MSACPTVCITRGLLKSDKTCEDVPVTEVEAYLTEYTNCYERTVPTTRDPTVTLNRMFVDIDGFAGSMPESEFRDLVELIKNTLLAGFPDTTLMGASKYGPYDDEDVNKISFRIQYKYRHGTRAAIKHAVIVEVMPRLRELMGDLIPIFFNKEATAAKVVKHLSLDTNVYNVVGRKMRMWNSSKDGQKRPNRIESEGATVLDTLITYLPDLAMSTLLPEPTEAEASAATQIVAGKKKSKVTAAAIAPPSVVTEDPAASIVTVVNTKDLLYAVLMGLSDKRYTDNSEWIKIGLILFNETKPLAMWEQLTRIRYPRYDHGSKRNCKASWNSFASASASATARVGEGTAWFWLKEDNPVLCAKLKRKAARIRKAATAVQAPVADDVASVSSTIREFTHAETAAGVTTPLPSPPRTEYEIINELCECLTPEWLADVENLMRLVSCLKHLTSASLPDETAQELFVRHVVRGAQEGVVAPVPSPPLWNLEDTTPCRNAMSSLKHYARTCNPTRYFATTRSSNWALVRAGTVNSYCELFYNTMAGDILYSTALKCYYIYDAREGLWCAATNIAIMNSLFVAQASTLFDQMVMDLPIPTTEFQIAAQKADLATLKRARKVCEGASVVTLVNSFLPAFCCERIDPAAYFDQNPDLLPLKNGVWSFPESRLIPYQREHYFTFRIAIAYNPAADTSLMQRAALDWFAGNVDVAEFIQYWIGYCMTGYTKRQDFMIAWGTSAGNGKSLLWGEIMSILLGPYYHTITSDALASDRTGNNDQLYNMNGKRFACLSEPRKGYSSKLDNELIKTLTGDKLFTAEAKFKGAMTFAITSKIGLICNDMPNIEFNKTGTKRRVQVAEQNVSFVDAEAYAVLSPADRASSRFRLRDDAFVDALKANVEGLMVWALQGSMAFMREPRRMAPVAMACAKARATEEADVFGEWIRSNIRNLNSGRPNKSVRMRTIKELMRTHKVDFGQNSHGFERIMREKTVELGYDVTGRDGKGDFTIQYAEVIVDDAVPMFREEVTL